MSGPCSETTPGHCADCGKPIPNFDDAKSADHRYRNMSGMGYQSQTARHNHLKAVRGMLGVQPVKRELCAECYTTDFNVKYPPDADYLARQDR